MLATMLLVALCVRASLAWTCTASARPAAAVRRASPAVTMQFENSLAGKMFGDVFKGLKGAADSVKDAVSQDDDTPEIGEVTGAGSDDAAADLDARAKTGDITFNDFLTMSSAFTQLGGKQVPGMPEMSAKQLLETREKFTMHEKIVEVMLDEEREDAELVINDLKEGD